MAQIPKTWTLEGGEDQTIVYDTVTNEYSLTVGDRDPIVYTRNDVVHTNQVMNSMGNLEQEFERLKALPFTVGQPE